MRNFKLNSPIYWRNSLISGTLWFQSKEHLFHIFSAEHALKIAEIENHLDIFPIEADLDQQTFEYGSLSEEDDPSALDSLAKELESFELEDTHSKEDAEDSLINFD